MKPLLVAAALLLAGCTGPLLGGGDLTAKDAYPRAVERARQWSATAALVGAAGPEVALSEVGNESGRDEFPFEGDGTVGDGRAPQWFFEFVSTAMNRSLGVGVYRNGTVLAHEDEFNDKEGDALDPTLWQVDSPRAFEVAKQDANISRAAQAPDASFMVALAPRGAGSGAGMEGFGGTDPFWVIAGGSESAGAGGAVFVNARTAERFQFPFPFGNFSFPSGFPFGGDAAGGFRRCSEQSGTEGGDLGPTAIATQEFDVDEGCERVELDLRWNGTAPTDRAVVEVRGPDGGVVEPDEESLEANRYTATFEDPEAGDWEATIRLGTAAPGGIAPPTGVRVTYELTITVT